MLFLSTVIQTGGQFLERQGEGFNNPRMYKDVCPQVSSPSEWDINICIQWIRSHLLQASSVIGYGSD